MLIKLPSAIIRAASLLLQHNYQVYLVGGSIRALLMGTEPKDYDLTTDASPEKVLEIFSAYRTSKIGAAFGTILVVIGKYPLEITTMRLEGSYHNHRHPDQVVFSTSILADLARRDFTINAIAWPITLPASFRGTGFSSLPWKTEDLVDPYGGRQDLAARLIRSVGQPESRLQEDALRILRALRFKARLGFCLEKKTARALHSHAHLLAGLARERVLAELRQIFVGQHLTPVLTNFLNVLAAALPELQPLVQKNSRPGPEALKAIKAVTLLPADFELRLLVLLLAAADISKTSPPAFAARALEGLRADRKTIASSRLILKARENLPRPDKSSIKLWLKTTPPRLARAALLLEKARADEKPAVLAGIIQTEEILERILQDGECFQLADLAVSGQDIISLGLLSGPAVGQVLDQLLDLVILDQLPNEKNRLLVKAADLISQGTGLV